MNPSTFRQIQEEAHQIARDKGWWDNERSFLECIALCHSELSEAVEEVRRPDTEIHELIFIDGKLEGVGIELADAVIRIADTAEAFGIDLGFCLAAKMQYNKTRPYRHGGKRA